MRIGTRSRTATDPAPPYRNARMRPVIAVLAIAAAACSSTPAAPGTSVPAAASTTPTSTSTVPDFFDSSLVHELAVEFDGSAYDEMIDVFAATGDKEWIEATVTIDGAVYEQVEMRLKGSSSLSGLRNDLSASSDATGDADRPETLPWLIRLDRAVDDQNHQGRVDLVVRPNASVTALNEAVALELLGEAGLPTQKAVATGFSVNGSDPVLRLVIEHPDEVWMETNFSAEDALYKSDAEGDWSYRGDDPDVYEDVFDIEAGDDNADLAPLLELIGWLNSSDDETFAAELGDRLDIDAFATYLAAQDLIANHDDIDGRGNNSYLHLDPATGVFTVVAWDHNLAFGAFGALPPGSDGGILQGENVLADRFHATPAFEARYQQRLADLAAELYDSGIATGILDRWVALLQSEASHLVDPAVVAEEAAAITPYFGIGP